MLYLIKDLSKAVSSYIYYQSILNFNITGEVIVSIEVLTYLDVFSTFIVLGVSSKVNSRAVILVDQEGSQIGAIIDILYKLLYLEDFFGDNYKAIVFSFI